MVSRGDRVKFLSVSQVWFFQQSYSNILEWILIDGSQSIKESEIFTEYCKTLQELYPSKQIRTSPWIGKRNIGAYRNQANSLVKGDIVVSFDDDDYYFSDRVKHSVEKLTKSNCRIGGCEIFYIYDVDMDRTFLTDVPAGYTCNNTIAYTHAIAKSRKYDETVSHAEEPSFYGDETIVQFDRDCMTVQVSHISNTYSKRSILLEGIAKSEGISPVSSTKLLDKTPYDILPKSDHERFQSLISVSLPETKPKDPHDIVYYCGTFNDEWDPASQSLGGSEQAVVHTSTELVAKGKSVIVYGNLKEKEYKGVQYVSFKKFNIHTCYKTLLLWRLNGCMILPLNLSADRIFVDLHDGFSPQHKVLHKHLNKVHTFFFKSQFHKRMFESAFKTILSDTHYSIQPNGVRIEEFSKEYAVQRDPYRFVYASSYDRGLIWILKGFWPILRQIEPRCELHVYYGISDKMKPETRALLNEVLLTEGVMNHGRQPVDVLAREKQRAGFHLYPCFSNAEIDCITVRESLVAGCIPLLAKYGVFTERDGVHLDMDVRNPATFLKSVLEILQLARNTERMNELRETLQKSPTITSWSDSADAILQRMKIDAE
jgi:glycosyltransferase involved in cell wall biosynthesis